METYTLDQIVDLILANKGKWTISTFKINTDRGIFSLGVKAFGKWAQRIECCGIADGVPEQKTQKAFRAEFHKTVTAIVSSL